MQVVIDIPEEDYNLIKGFTGGITVSLYKAVQNGTPLPKGHGDLKDTEKLKNAFITWSTAVNGNFTDADIASIIYNSPTIIDADKEAQDEETREMLTADERALFLNKLTHWLKVNFNDIVIGGWQDNDGEIFDLFFIKREFKRKRKTDNDQIKEEIK